MLAHRGPARRDARAGVARPPLPRAARRRPAAGRRDRRRSRLRCARHRGRACTICSTPRSPSRRALAGFAVVETWAGLRPGSPDGRPYLGATALEGYVVAAGHFRNGILLAPITARLIAELIVDGTQRRRSARSTRRASTAGSLAMVANAARDDHGQRRAHARPPTARRSPRCSTPSACAATERRSRSTTTSCRARATRRPRCAKATGSRSSSPSREDNVHQHADRHRSRDAADRQVRVPLAAVRGDGKVSVARGDAAGARRQRRARSSRSRSAACTSTTRAARRWSTTSTANG